MANPRRTSLQSQPHILPLSFASSSSSSPSSVLNSLSLFLKRPQAFPFLLSIFVLVTWLSLRYSSSSSSSSPHFHESKLNRNLDLDANLLRLSTAVKDERGWIVNPVNLALENGIHVNIYVICVLNHEAWERVPGFLDNPKNLSLVLNFNNDDVLIRGGAQFCASLHAGEIRPGKIRGNHRHHTCNETLVIWGAATKFRLENSNVEDKGYAEASVGANEVAVATSPAGTAHALINVDRVRSTFFLGCQDSAIDYNSSTTDFGVWKDL